MAGTRYRTAVWAIVFLMIPCTAALALVSPHDAGNGIVCQDCHSFVLQNGMMIINVPSGAEQEVVCKGCHNPEGQAAAMSSVGNHVVNDNSTIIDCGACHDPHNSDVTTDPHTGIEADNLNLIRKTVRRVDGALDPAIFQQKPDHFAFDESSAPWDGICQTCHTVTAHHTNSAVADHTHEEGTNCVGCHPHDAGFLPSGGDCTGCHSIAQDNGDGVPVGGRRAAAAEFPTGSAGLHAHYGAQLDSDSCLVCHSVGTHMDGYVELIDPDSGDIYRFLQPADLAADPDLSTFCAGCHDADGAQRLAAPLDPFGNGNTPPNVAERFQGTLQWEEYYGDFCFGYEGTLRQVNSHHDISDADQAWSGAKVECLNCHGAHNASADTPIADPANQSQVWTGDMNGFCLSCHDGGNGPLDPLFPLDVIGTDVVGPVVPQPCVVDNATLGTFMCASTGEVCTGTDDLSCPSVSGLRGLDTGDCSYNTTPWWVNYTWTHSPHGPDSKRYWPGYPNLPGSDAVLDCTVCHDPHGSYTATNTAGNPYMIRDFVDGTQFIDDGNRPNPATWTAVPGDARDVVVSVSGTSVSWENLCSVCHATWLDAYSWHSYCNGCQTCHGHGQSWDGYDWGPGNDDDTLCWEELSGAPGASMQSSTVNDAGEFGSSAVHEGIEGQSCSECHVLHR